MHNALTAKILCLCPDDGKSRRLHLVSTHTHTHTLSYLINGDFFVSFCLYSWTVNAGIGDDVSPQVLRSAMIPFGNIKSLDIPMDYKVGKTRGFAFVEFEDHEDGKLIFIADQLDFIFRIFESNFSHSVKKHISLLNDHFFCFYFLFNIGRKQLISCSFVS